MNLGSAPPFIMSKVVEFRITDQIKIVVEINIYFFILGIPNQC